jgi:hypothetical protein
LCHALLQQRQHANLCAVALNEQVPLNGMHLQQCTGMS